MTPPLSDEMENKLSNLYYKDGYMFGRDKLFSLIKDLELDISRRQIAEWLKKQEVNQLYQPTRRNKIIQPTILKEPFKQIGVDIADMQNDSFKYKYLLTAIDLFSKYGWGEPLINKEASTVSKAMEKIIKRMDKYPTSLRTDNGSEFKSDTFQKMIKKYDIKHVFSLPGKPQSNGQIERFNGIIKRLLRKIMIYNDSREWETYLQQAINNYNDVQSRITKEAPKYIVGQDKRIEENIRKAVTNNRDSTDKIYSKGDKVRIKIETKDQSNKNWSKELYIIEKVSKPRGNIAAPFYRIIERDTGELIKGKFYNNDLLRVNEIENPIEEPEKYEISRLVKYEVRNGTPGFIVKWKGYNDKYNTFEPLESLKKDVPKMVNLFLKTTYKSI